ncbi:hypothetical protein ONZ45_g18634 [Pleurotus djamor]|nr:hypothetical protein ONZ45_g18634 [Pleurotus djamor]
MAYIARSYHNLNPSSTAGIAVELTKRGLGYRSANYQPNKWDYFSYVNLRDSFLHSPRGFAALLHGGVIGRMAREVVNPEILLEALLDPEPDAAYFEPLSENEIALLCGAYEFDTGKTSNAGKAQYANVSWWPRPTTWNKSTLSGPCWTDDAERWYVDRHRTLMKGNFSVNALLTAAKWKSSLRFTAKISKILHKIQDVTTEYLDGRIRSVCTIRLLPFLFNLACRIYA